MTDVTAADIAEALRPVIREEVRRALAFNSRPEKVSVATAMDILDAKDRRTVYARLAAAGRSPVKDRRGRVTGIRQADLDALLAARL